MPKLRVIIKPPPEPQGDAEQQTEALRDYLLQMSEELAYVLTHLEADNINDSTFERIQSMIPRPYTGLPVMDGDASSGQSEQWARGDHRHPKDASKADVTALATETAAREAHEADTGNPHEVTKAQVGLGNVANERQYSAQNLPPIPTPGEVGAIPVTEKGSAGGVAELDSSGHVPSSQLPSYVDDVLEYPSITDFPIPGESGKIYLAIDTDLFYRWGGTVYAPTNPSLALGETSETAYRGDRGKTAYDHSQTAGNPHGTTAADVGAQPSVTASGILMGDGLGGVSAATAGTDYQTPLTAGTDYQTPLVAGTDYQTPLTAGTDYQTPLTAGTDYQTPLVAGTDYATPGMIPTVPDPSDATPQDLGTAAAGVSGDYSRADHVHALPEADDIPYDNTVSGLMATDVQNAIDEIAQGGGGGTAASAVSYDNTGSGLAATNVQDAIDEVYGDIPSQPSDIGAQPTITASGILKGDGAGGVTAATPGTDYQTPLTAGTDYATPAQLADKANQSQLAYVETSTTASRAYALGDYFCLNGYLRKATAAISQGATITDNNSTQIAGGGMSVLAESRLFKQIGAWNSGSKTIAVPRGYGPRFYVFGSAVSAYNAFLIASSDGSGNVQYTPILQGTGISFSTGTGTLTVTLQSSGNTVVILEMPFSYDRYSTVN